MLREPAVTTDITDSDIELHRANRTKPQLPNLPIHSQSVERVVKLVTEASDNFFGYESRHRAIQTKFLTENVDLVINLKAHMKKVMKTYFKKYYFTFYFF